MLSKKSQTRVHAVWFHFYEFLEHIKLCVCLLWWESNQRFSWVEEAWLLTREGLASWETWGWVLEVSGCVCEAWRQKEASWGMWSGSVPARLRPTGSLRSWTRSESHGHMAVLPQVQLSSARAQETENWIWPGCGFAKWARWREMGKGVGVSNTKLIPNLIRTKRLSFCYSCGESNIPNM